MIIHYINSTDLISKTIAIAPTIDSSDNVPTANSILNFFGDIKMTIHATLEPIDLLYLLETHHNIKFDNELECDIDLTVGDIFYHIPATFFEKIYSGSSYSEILTDNLICGLLGESLSNDARRRFANNKYVDNVISDDGVFNGYTLNLIGVDDSKYMIPPITPENKIQIDNQKLFESDLTDAVIHKYCHDDHHLNIKGIFSKRATFDDLRYIVKSGGIVDNINYSIHSMIAEGIIPESMYGISKVKNIVGGEHETIDFDINGVNDIIATTATIPVVFHIINDYTCRNKTFILNDQSEFNQYLDAVMSDNIDSIVHEYFPDPNAEYWLLSDEDKDDCNTDDESKKEDTPVNDNKDIEVSEVDDFTSIDEDLSVFDDPSAAEDAFSLIQNEGNGLTSDGNNIDKCYINVDTDTASLLKDNIAVEKLVCDAFDNFVDCITNDMDNTSNSQESYESPSEPGILADEAVSLLDEEDAIDGAFYSYDAFDDDDGDWDDVPVDESTNNNDIINDAVDEKSDSDQIVDINISSREFEFFACRATFDTIAMIERNEEYQKEGIEGIIAMDYIDDMPTTYLIGKPYRYSDDSMVMYKWSKIEYTSLFEDPNTAYKVHHWHDRDKITDDVLFVDYNRYIKCIGGELNVKTIL